MISPRYAIPPLLVMIPVCLFALVTDFGSAFLFAAVGVAACLLAAGVAIFAASRLDNPHRDSPVWLKCLVLGFSTGRVALFVLGLLLLGASDYLGGLDASGASFGLFAAVAMLIAWAFPVVKFALASDSEIAE